MIRRLLSCAVLALLLVGPPLVLVAWGQRWDGVPLTGPVDVRLLLLILTVVGWLAWVAWCVAVAVELVGMLTGRPRLRLPGLGLFCGVAASLLATAMTMTATPMAASAPTTPTLDRSPGPALAGTPAVESPAGEAAVSEETDEADMLAVGSASAGQPAGRSVPHRVVATDDLWSLAEHYYGTGTEWRRIVDANPSLQTDPLAPLPEGTTLDIADPVRLVTVIAGDSLSRLAQRHLGDAARWPEIHRLNRDAIADPDMIDIGWVLRVPWMTDARAGAASDAAPVKDTVPVGAMASTDASPTDDTPNAIDVAGVDEDPRSAPDGDDGAPTAAEAERSDDDSMVESAEARDESLPEAPEGATAWVEDPAEADATLTVAPQESGTDGPAVVGLVGGLSSVTAAAVLGGIAARRRQQEMARPVGRRYASPAPELTRFETALGLTQAERREDRSALIDRAQRHLARWWWQRGRPVAELAEAVVSPGELTWTFADDPGDLPPWLEAASPTDRRATANWADIAALPDTDHPAAYPALVTVGEDDLERLVMVDLVASRVLGVRAERETQASELLSAILVELACAPWARDLTLQVVSDDPFARVIGGQRVSTSPDAHAAIAAVEAEAVRRRAALDRGSWARHTIDPDLADAWQPFVVVFERPLGAAQSERLEVAVEATPCGLAAVLPVDAGAGEATWSLTDAGDHPRLVHDGRDLTPQAVPVATREAIGALYTVAESTATERAPWWNDPEPEEPVNIVELYPRVPPTGTPRVLLLGPLDLVGAAGERPAKAVRQCIEYCAWLLENPGSTPTQMGRELFVSEPTRRSNLSRLRLWLGSSSDGSLHLPDAYSGRIRLHDDVTSDWRDLQLLTAGGVKRMSIERLTLALELVRGAPLADAAPGQWAWAEWLRSDMVALIRDVGVMASRLARERGDLEAARWAANRALQAAPFDELLLGERIRTEQAAGRVDEVDRLVQRVYHQARQLGSDLLPETIDLIQECVEGQLRARRA